MKLTKWLGPEITPVRPGWYETSAEPHYGSYQMTYWNGFTWSWREANHYECLFQKRYWRGLTKPAQ